MCLIVLVSLCSVCDIRWVCRFGSELFILFLILVFGMSVVIELMMIMLIEFECISVLVILRVCLLVFGCEISSFGMFMLSFVVY